MYKYIKSFQLGYERGVKDAIIMKFKNINFIKIYDRDIISKLYDIGYIKGYKKTSFKNNKNIV